jgi:DNA-binding response OmpR family regulator
MALRVLLVDDDTDIRTIFHMAFQAAGFEVREAVDGLNAIGILQIEEFDAIVLDMSMPRVDGVSALDTFRILKNGRTVPVIAVTALDDPVVEKRAMEAGAAALLHKPLSPNDVVAEVQKHIDAANAS